MTACNLFRVRSRPRRRRRTQEAMTATDPGKHNKKLITKIAFIQRLPFDPRSPRPKHGVTTNLPICNHEAIYPDFCGSQFDSREASVFRNALKFRESVSITGGGSDEHHDAERSGSGR